MIKRVAALAAAIALTSIVIPSVASAEPYLSWGRAVHDAHVIVGNWVKNQNADWSNLSGVQATGRDCWRGNRRTMFCEVSFTGTYTDSVYGISQDFQVYGEVRMYLLKNGVDLYRQVGSLWSETLSTPYVLSYAKRVHSYRPHRPRVRPQVNGWS